jgi:hypothetical protein
MAICQKARLLKILQILSVIVVRMSIPHLS